MKKIGYFFLCFLFIASFSWGQKQKPYYDFVTIKEGISKVGIYTIIQDDLGFVWLGTNGSGLYRYDGTSYQSYKYEIDDVSSLSSSLVFSSFLDKKNRLWFGTENGLCLYDRENDRFKRILNSNFKQHQDLNISVTAIAEDANGSLFVGTSDLGLYKMNLDDYKIEKVVSKESLESLSLSVNAIKISENGEIYVGTDRGLKLYDYKTNTLREASFDSGIKNITNSVESLAIDDNNTIWVGTTFNGLYKIESKTSTNKEKIFSLQNFSFSTNKFLSLLLLKDGSLLCGTENNGLYHIDNKGVIINYYSSDRANKNSILSNSIWTLYQDINNRIWLGYYNTGVSVYDKLYDKFNEIESLGKIPNTLSNPSVTAIVQDSKDNLWLATDGGGINIYNKQTKEIDQIGLKYNKLYRGLKSDYIECLYIDSKQNIWAGSWDQGLFFLKKGTKKFINYNVKNTNGALNSNAILSITEDTNGTIWIGTFYTGLHSFNPKTKEFKYHNEKEFSEKNIAYTGIRKVLIDSENIMWLATEIGLFKVKKQGNKYEVISMREKMPVDFKKHNSSNNIVSIFESNDKTIWVGTRGAGLCRYDRKSDSFQWFNKSNGLIEENINSIIESSDKTIWLTGDSGVTKLNRKNQTFTSYTNNDGLLSNQFNINAVFKDNENLLYFGNFQGVDFFDPSDIITNKNLPVLYLTDLKIFNESVQPNKEKSPLKKVISRTDRITLDSKQSVFTVEYSSINFTRPEKNEYAYYLEGYENSWNYVGKKRSATYTNLDAGNYVFKLKASNNDGIWNEEPLALNITILPPWWKTNWAILAYILLFIGGVYVLIKIAQTRIKDKQLVENERNNRLLEKELNEKKLQFFTNISHEFRTPLSLIISPLEEIIKGENDKLSEKIRQKLFTVHKNTNRLYRLINELIDFRKLDLDKVRVKARKLNLVSFSKNIMTHFKEEASIKNIHLTIDADMQDIPIWADENMLEKIVFNILSNAFKVTPEGGAITIELYSKEDILPLTNKNEKIKAVAVKISDTGPGLTESQIEKIFERFYRVDNLNKTYYGGTGIGLEVVQNFVKLHKGNIKVDSQIGKGTSFKIIFPEGNTYFEENQLLEQNTANTKEDDFLIAQQNIDEVKETVINEGENTNFKTLLIVEDNTELRNYLNTEFKNYYKILLAKNGKEGLKLAVEHLPDVIITDVIMPEMDGFAFCKHIKSDLKTSHIPLMMLTAKTTIENRKEGIENGADAYMVKPFDMGLLKLRLSQLITSRQLIFNKYFSVISDADNATATSVDKEFIEKVLSFINENLDDTDLNVESLAAQLNLSRSQFYRKIKALTNQTATEFIRNIRLIRAKQIIETGNKNISEVCYKVGFSSPSYFSKCFKAHFGILPKDIGLNKK